MAQNQSRDSVEKIATSDAVAREGARQALIEKQADLIRLENEAKQRRSALLRELQRSEAELHSLTRRIDAIGELLTLDFPAPTKSHLSDQQWKEMPLPQAVSEVLAEAGGFLTDSQIREGLAHHGLGTDDTTTLSRQLDESVESADSPLLKIAPRLWARADWAEQARFSVPSLLRKKGH